MTNLLKIAFFIFLLPGFAQAQVCTAPGQNPSTAFPICGTTVFHQTTVPICGSHTLIVPGCENDGAGYGDKNPYWYKFTCYQSGSLAFLIKPLNENDDYDWQLYDITGHDPNDVFTNVSLVVTGNWAGTYGYTGANDYNGAGGGIQCASDPKEKKNSFAKAPQLIVGHTYLLLVSHYTNSQSGYDLSFFGGTAVITDPTLPHLKTAEAACTDRLRIKLSKNIKCSSIAPNGSDFTINAPGISVVSSTGAYCSEKFDTDSVLLQLSASLDPGTYTIGVKSGSDGNTLQDYCDNQVPVTDAVQVLILPKQPTPMDSLTPVTCAPRQLHLVFQKLIQCSSIAADGTDFNVTGSYPVQVVSATGTCTDEGLSKEIVVTLNQPLQQGGNFHINLQRGSDGTTILNECNEETPEGSSLMFSIKDTVNADFSYAIKYGCVRDTISVFHKGGNGITTWNWDLDNRQRSNAQNPQGVYTIFDAKNLSLIVSNGFCSDTSRQTVQLENYLKADFSVFADNCPNEPINFTGNPQGKIKSHYWEFGDGSTANTQSPTYTFRPPDRERVINIRYTVTDSFGCQSTAQKPINLYPICYVTVPTAFTPNGDGLNDFLAPLAAVKAINLEFRVYNRWGQLVYASTNWKQGWDGTFKGQPQPTATYVWMLQFTNRDTGKKQQLKGTAVLIR